MNQIQSTHFARLWGCFLLILGLLACVPSALFSQDGAAGELESDEAAPRGAVEAVGDEITVTARKREEVLSDVPIAITLVSGEQLQESNTSDLSSLSLMTTNFTHSEDVNSFDRFIVRGLGTTGSNLGFEEAVGQVINGYFFGRSRFG